MTSVERSSISPRALTTSAERSRNQFRCEFDLGATLDKPAGYTDDFDRTLGGRAQVEVDLNTFPEGSAPAIKGFEAFFDRPAAAINDVRAFVDGPAQWHRCL